MDPAAALPFFLRGLLAGASIAASVGPIWLLCARRTLVEGRLVGLASGLGVATADGIYGALAALGFTALAGLLLDQAAWLRAAGGAFLLYLGVRAFQSHPVPGSASAPPPGGRAGTPARALLAAYASTLGLTLANPPTIVAFAGIFAGLGLADAGGSVAAGLVLAAGVAAGSAAWWVVLTTALERARARLTARFLLRVNQVSGALLAAFGAAALLSALPRP